MKGSTPKFLAVLLAAWGLFNMGFPLWRAAQITQTTGVFADLPSWHLAVGLTAVIAGLALYVVCERIDELTKHVASRGSASEVLESVDRNTA